MYIKRIPGGARGRCKTVVAGNLVWTVGTAGGATVAEQTRATLNAI